MPGPLLNVRYEVIAQSRASGKSQMDAVAEAGLSKNSANRICRRPDVLARVHELNPKMRNLGGVFIPPPRRSNPKRRVMTQQDVIADLMELARACRANGNFREANLALKNAAAQIAIRDGLHLPPRPTKKQREQRQRNASDPQGDLSNDQPADNGGTPDISEIADVVGRLNDGPGDLTEEEADRAVASSATGSVHEADGNR